MSDDNDNFSAESENTDSLLDELGSIKGLLDEELKNEEHYRSQSEIKTVEEYVRIKHKAEEAGLSITEYLEQLAEEDAAAEAEVEEQERTPSPVESNEQNETSPSTTEPTTVEEYFAAVAASKRQSREMSPEQLPDDELPVETSPLSVEPEGNTLEIGDVAETVETGATYEENIPMLDEVAETNIPVLDAVATTEEPSPTSVDEAEPDLIIPVLDEVATQGNESPVPDDVAAEYPVLDDVPVLDEVAATEDAIPTLDEVVPVEQVAQLHDESPLGVSALDEAMNLEEMQDLVDLIVNRKLERLKPELEKEVLQELQKVLPVSALTKH